MSHRLKETRPAKGTIMEQLTEGVRLFREGNFRAAGALFEDLAAAHPENADARWHAGRTLIKLKEPERGIPHLERAAALLPRAPEPCYDLGLALLAAKRPGDAASWLAKAASLRPEWVEAWSNLGFAQESAGLHAQAQATLLHALSLNPKHAETLNHLGALAKAKGALAEALEYFLAAISEQPNFGHAWCNLGNTLVALNCLDQALDAYREAQRVDPTLTQTKFFESLIHLLRGNLSKPVWLKYEYRFVTLNYSPQRGYPQELWRGEQPLSGRSIFLHPDQGLGDTLQFIRYVSLLVARGATVHLEVQPPLKALLADFPGAASVIVHGEPLPNFDCHCPLLSLPFAFDTQLDTIPSAVCYLRAPAAKSATWAAQFSTTLASGPLRVGVVWRGNPKHANDSNRSMPFETFRRLFDLEDCTFVSLQVGPNERESEVTRHHPHCVDPTAQINDFTDTAAIVENLDLIISVDTSIVHLAGAMGKPVWVLLPYAPDWRWMLERNDSPWYPTMRLFRQTAVGDWSTVLAEVERELRARSTSLNLQHVQCAI